jgi:glucose/arabinose dehydrogenase
MAVALAVILAWTVSISTATTATAAVPSGFAEVTAFSGLVNPTAVRFAPGGKVFVAEKRGTIQMYDGLGDTTATQVADLRTEVYNYWDRGLLGLAVDPGFASGRPFLYALYTYDGPIGGPAPRWGTPGADSDPCPNPPGATTDGCVVSGKLAKLTLNGTSTTKQDLIHDWCQQYPSHSIGDLVFGPDGALYASGGDGASFEFVDYGQVGNPVNPCGDPPGGVGGAMTAPSAEGGALRSQDLRTPADPTTLDGTVIRVSPDTGAALADNPGRAATDANARRIIAYGLRNPFRLSVRPGTNEVWLGDVGSSFFEEVNRIANPTAGVPNFGWPCYEGDGRHPSYDGANLKICEDMYTQGTVDTKPYFAYRHGQPLNASDNCNSTRGSSGSGLSFQFNTGGAYPAEYADALFFSDFSRNCIWVMTKGTDGLPDKVKTKPFVSGAAGPVDLEMSPSGELFYVDFAGGTVRRIVYGSSGPASCSVGQYRAEYFSNKTLTGSPSSILCEGSPLAHDWGGGAPAGLGPDNFSARWTGSFDFATASTYSFTAVSDDGIRVWVDDVLLIDQWKDQPATTFTASRALTAGRHTVKVEWFETGGDAVAKLSWTGGGTNSPPQPTINSPVSGTTWKVGDSISFTGSATDAQDGTLPPSALSWEVIQAHCPSDCHEHQLQTWSGVSGGSFNPPDHGYPSHLELRLTATDSAGLQTRATRRLDPQTVQIQRACSSQWVRRRAQRRSPAP